MPTNTNTCLPKKQIIAIPASCLAKKIAIPASGPAKKIGNMSSLCSILFRKKATARFQRIMSSPTLHSGRCATSKNKGNYTKNSSPSSTKRSCGLSVAPMLDLRGMRQSTILAQAASKLILKLGLQILFSSPCAFGTVELPKRRLLTGRDIVI